MNKTTTVLFLIALAACATKKTIAPAEAVKPAQSAQADIDRMAAKFPGFTLAEYNEGKALYEGNCARCHKLKDPRSRDEGGWNGIVPKMVEKVNHKTGATTIDEAGQRKIIRYLVTTSTAPATH